MKTYKVPEYVQNTTGYALLIDVGFDFTGYADLSVRVMKPDGTVVVRSAAEGVTDNGDPTQHLVLFPVNTTTLTDTIGTYRVYPLIDGQQGYPAANYVVVAEGDDPA